MKLNDLLNRKIEWLKGTGPESEIVISSRVRLARNIDAIPFSHWAKKKDRQEILELSKKAIQKSNLLLLHPNDGYPLIGRNYGAIGTSSWF